MTSASATKTNKQPKPAAVEAAPEPVIVAFKGFDKDFRCRGYQFAEGQTFIHEGKVEACKGGFHACEHPLNVFDYYPPAESRFATVTLSGETHRESNGDTKIAGAKITITAELTLHAFIGKAVEWLVSKASPATSNHATGDQSAASATGYRSAASATGYRSAASATGYRSAASATGGQSAASATGGQSAASATGGQSAASATGYQSAASATGGQSAASATGDQSAASATGDQSAASATGDQSAASATGYRSAASATGYRSAASATGDQSAASATGYQSAAMACGREGSVSGKAGNALFLVERDGNWNIIAVWAGIAGKDGIEPDVPYTLRDGKPVRVSPTA
jgi:hypothetical protein